MYNNENAVSNFISQYNVWAMESAPLELKIAAPIVAIVGVIIILLGIKEMYLILFASGRNLFRSIYKWCSYFVFAFFVFACSVVGGISWLTLGALLVINLVLCLFWGMIRLARIIFLRD